MINDTADDTADDATDKIALKILEELPENKTGKFIVLACLDDSATAALLAHRKEIARLCNWEVSNWPPHITLGGYEGVDSVTLCEWVRVNAAQHPAFEIRFSSFAVFPRHGDDPDSAVLFVAPASTPALIELYFHLHEQFDAHHDELGWFYTMQYGHPVLHSTVGRYPHVHMAVAMTYMLQNYVEVVARVVALEVYVYPMQLLARFPLREAQG